MGGMSRIVSIIIGCLSLVWISLLYPYLFEFLFVNVSLEPVIGPCRMEYGQNACRPLARVLLWFMSLPLNVVLVFVYSLIIVLADRYWSKFKLNQPSILLGLIGGYTLLAFYMGGPMAEPSYYIETVLTYSLLMVLGIKVCNHLTKSSN